jgi:2-hydroxychromene-2-carboxylate isomerase
MIGEQMRKIAKIDFYYSIGSRYSYLASTQIEQLQKETGCRIEWHPVNSMRLIAQQSKSPFEREPVSGQYEWDYRELDAKRWAEFYGVSYVEARGRVHFDSELLARSCVAAKCLGKSIVDRFLLQCFRIRCRTLMSENALLALKPVAFLRSISRDYYSN